ncbi:hypothetical protein ASZ78_007918 [Callipepla squamata]|uniref:Pro-neuregulin-2, membrane-bound isoform n=1 Tax=Callipepla squamata TaxID=9009 RepID=A0A226MZ79_CALSU|nr:hypothetical protein ASZ78_007918 [Callipepla squamata]
MDLIQCSEPAKISSGCIGAAVPSAEWSGKQAAVGNMAVPPKLKKLKSPNVHVGEKISLKCEATAGNPQPSYKWFKDGKELKKSKDIRIKYGNGKKISRLQFNKVKLEDAGEYSCEAENVLGKDTAKGSLNVRSGTTKAPQVLPASETKIVVMEEESTIPFACMKPAAGPLVPFDRPLVGMGLADLMTAEVVHWVAIMAQLTGRNLQGWGNLIRKRNVRYTHSSIRSIQNGNVILSLCGVKQPDEVLESVAMDLLVTTTLSSWSGHARKCNETAKSYCVNGGVCYYIEGINQLSCKCPNGFFGQRCLEKLPLRLYMPDPKQKAEELYQKRVLTITGICVALLVVGIVCVVAYCKTKKQRKQMHNHLRQNMCHAHQNRSLANGPSHPRLDPEEIQMADKALAWIPCSLSLWALIHRHESHTWSLERTESLTSDSQSGIMLSSVGTSKCNSPACVEARARRGAAFCIEDSRRPTTQYRDSVDSLRDSPHSERYVSALTTPARLSPVDFHYSMAAQVPTFEITSPNSAHAVSLPPAAPISFRVEEQQPLLRRCQLPFQDTQRYDSYYQRKTYLNDSMGSLPSSPFRITEDDEYETTQEYVTALEQPKKTASSNRRWKKSKLNGHVPHRARAVRDSFSFSSASYSESDEELVAESTPFLSTQNNEATNTESPPLHRPSDSRTQHPYSRHSAHGGSGRSSLAHTTPKREPDPL